MGSKTRTDGPTGNSGSHRDRRAADDSTPLLHPPQASAHLAVPAARPDYGTRPVTDREQGDEIDPNVFDILLSKSLPTSGGFLEPESYENPMLRGVRRYSTGRRPSAGSLARSDHRLSSGQAPATDEEEAVRSPVDQDHEGPSSPAHEVPEDTPLLAPSTSHTSTRSSPSSPYLNGISVQRFWFIFSGILATYFIACFDGTIMASSHPVITSYFESSNSASWLSTAFLLTSTAFQPLLGRISDTIGRKPPYLITMVIFALSTLWCALAQSMTSFILARAACGIGAGGMMTLGSIIISDMVPIEVRGTYQSLINMIYGVGSALGAALGGAMADYLGWRWEFGVQVVPLLLCVVVAAFAIPNDLGLVGKKQTFWEALKVFDFRGSILLTTSLTFLVLGLNMGGNVLPWSHPFVISSLVIFTLGFPSFIYAQSQAERPIMPLRLIRRGPHANLMFSNFFGSLIMNAILFNIPLFFQAVLLTTATASGFRLVIPSIVSSATGTATGFIITRTRRLKWALVAGTFGFLVGSFGLSLLRRGWHPVLYLLVLVPHSIGQGFQFPGTLMSVLAASEQRDQAVVTATLILWRSLGTVLGVASSSLVVQNALVAYLKKYVTGERKWEVIDEVRSSVEAVVKLPEPYREQVILSYEAALRLTFSVCTLLALVSFFIVLPVRLPKLGQRK